MSYVQGQAQRWTAEYARRAALAPWVVQATDALTLLRRRALSKGSSRRWQQRHPDRNACRRANVRARNVAIGGHVTPSEWRAKLEEFGHRCAYCRKSAARLEKDHVIALADGGAHTIENLVPACRSCNARKGSNGPLAMIGVH